MPNLEVSSYSSHLYHGNSRQRERPIYSRVRLTLFNTPIAGPASFIALAHLIGIHIIVSLDKNPIDTFPPLSESNEEASSASTLRILLLL